MSDSAETIAAQIVDYARAGGYVASGGGDFFEFEHHSQDVERQIVDALRASEERAEKARDDIMTLGQALGAAEARVKELEAALRKAEKERSHQHGRADRNAKEHARQQARAEAAEARVKELEAALARIVAIKDEHPMWDDDGSGDMAQVARTALGESHER